MTTRTATTAQQNIRTNISRAKSRTAVAITLKMHQRDEVFNAPMAFGMKYFTVILQFTFGILYRLPEGRSSKSPSSGLKRSFAILPAFPPSNLYINCAIHRKCLVLFFTLVFRNCWDILKTSRFHRWFPVYAVTSCVGPHWLVSANRLSVEAWPLTSSMSKSLRWCGSEERWQCSTCPAAGRITQRPTRTNGKRANKTIRFHLVVRDERLGSLNGD